jgi:hypothetical protein
MRILLLFLATLVLATTPARAEPVSVPTPVIGAEFQEELDENYGAREAEVLQRLTERLVAEALGRAGATVADADANFTVDITILDAVPNRPTFQQLSDRPGLSLASFGVGGARFMGVIRSASGEVLATIEHDFYANNIEDAWASTTWSDARFAARGFARKVAAAYVELT